MPKYEIPLSSPVPTIDELEAAQQTISIMTDNGDLADIIRQRDRLNARSEKVIKKDPRIAERLADLGRLAAQSVEDITIE